MNVNDFKDEEDFKRDFLNANENINAKNEND